jgi:lambda repressor-like predicted transcriptional regulator
MPRIYDAKEIMQDPKPKVMALIAKLKPGQSYVLLELSEETGISPDVLKRVTPKENKLIARVPGYHKPVILITCPESSTPPPRKRRK